MKNIERKRAPQDTVNSRFQITNLLARCRVVSNAGKQDMLRVMMTLRSLETILIACHKNISVQLLYWKPKFRSRPGFRYANYMSLLLILMCLWCFSALLYESGIFTNHFWIEVLIG
jgi:hypothetical protein